MADGSGKLHAWRSLMPTLAANRRYLCVLLLGAAVGALALPAAKLAYRTVKAALTPRTDAIKPMDAAATLSDRAAIVRLSRLEKFDIAMLGDSLTVLAPWQDLTGCASLSNRGLLYGKVRDLLDDGEKIKAFSPKLVFVTIGINDLLGGATAGDVLSDIEKLVGKTAPGNRLVLTSVLPVARGIGPPGIGEEIRKVNEGLGKIRSVEYLDLHSHMADRDGYLRASLTTDGVHLRAAGYEIWRNAAAPLVKEACPARTAQ